MTLCSIGSADRDQVCPADAGPVGTGSGAARGGQTFRSEGGRSAADLTRTSGGSLHTLRFRATGGRPPSWKPCDTLATAHRRAPTAGGPCSGGAPAGAGFEEVHPVGAFELMDGEFEQVVYNHDPASGLKAIIAIHSTALGPALGGTRFYPYATEEEALTDVLRLARGMSYKAAAAGLDLGGGKAVIIGDPKRIKSEALLRAYGRFVGSLGGRYITAEGLAHLPSELAIQG